MVNAGAGRGRLAAALAGFAVLVPATLLLAVLSHLPESLLAPGLGGAQRLQAALGALANDLLAVARYLPLLFTALVPLLLPKSSTLRLALATCLLGSLVLASLALTQYALRAGVPLGADLFAYSGDDLRQAVAGVAIDGRLATGAVLLLVATTWLVARVLQRAPAQPPGRLLAALALACVAAWGLRAAGLEPRARTEYLANLQANKLAWFIDDLRRATRATRAGAVAGPATAGAGNVHAAGAGTPADAAPATHDLGHGAPAAGPYPFLHDEHTPDVLGDWLQPAEPTQPPDIVLIIVEGLGRSFSGPGARLGSFTPFLDELAQRSLYWDDFIAPQGRTFGVLPSLLGSLPFGPHGFLDLPQPLPAHPSLPSLLAARGYATRFLSGTHAAFDGQLAYLQQAGFAQVLDRGHLDLDQPVANEWGYDDDTLLRYAARALGQATGTPRLDVIQTISMHAPFTVPDEATWRQRASERIARLGLDEPARNARLAYLDVYAAVLFTDDALRRYCEALWASPSGRRTLLVITGDHRLPEIPMDQRIERYHVPLLVASPMLRAPHVFHGISSHFDVTPSLIALLAHRHGLRRPARTPWLGGALATGDALSDGRSIPMMQTKAELSDFISGEWYLGHGRLYHLGPGLVPQESADAAQLARTTRAFESFLAANARFAAQGALMPAEAAAGHGGTEAAPAKPAHAATAPAASRAVSVPEAVAVAEGAAGHVAVRFVLANGADATSVAVAPLAVLLDANGRELKEAYGQAVQLQPRERLALHLGFDAAALPPGTYYVAVFASDPATGARIGEGRFHLPVAIGHAASP